MNTRNGFIGVAGIFVLLAASSSLQAQGFIIDSRSEIPISGVYEISDVTIDAKVRNQVAEVRVSHTVRNPTSRTIEAEYWFPLPDDAAIQDFVLMVDGKEMPGRLLPKDEARAIYEQIVRSKKDPALMEYMGRGLFRTSVFPIPAGASRTVTLRYTHLCSGDNGNVRFIHPLSLQKHTTGDLKKLTLNIDIQSQQPIKTVYSPSHDVSVKRNSDRDVQVRLTLNNVSKPNDFRLIYTHTEDEVAATLLSYRPDDSENGYFMLLASPGFSRGDQKHLPKTVIFVLDTSGSMSGKKIEQAKQALSFVLDNLNDGDGFNIISYNADVDSFQPEIQLYNHETRVAAKRYVGNIRAGGSTNIDQALRRAMSMITDDTQPAYVLFLTDGRPTAGEKDEVKIAANCKKVNDVGARLITFGVGYDVNARLLDRLSHANGGTSEFVKPEENIEAAVSRFYGKLTSPVLSDIKIDLAGVNINRCYPQQVADLFQGGQMVWAGRYDKSGKTNLTITGKVGAESVQFEYDVRLTDVDDKLENAFVA